MLDYSLGELSRIDDVSGERSSSQFGELAGHESLRHCPIGTAPSECRARTPLRTHPEFYNDWVVPESYYDQYDREVPVGVGGVGHAERRRRVGRGEDYTSPFVEPIPTD
ncbi:hypothetical protein [Halomarina salina]|uniref:hypothetical protein n=1 Tax=Halomarina salina TaxID=1872699 RepID=UPI001FF97541|nr:hypothetical protein [Halomarina salina]